MKKVTLRALERRINRKLEKEGERLCKARINTNEYSNLGLYHTINIYSNTVLSSNIDEAELVEMAKELKVMGEWEELATD